MNSTPDVFRSAFVAQNGRNGERRAFNEIFGKSPILRNTNRFRMRASTSIRQIDDIEGSEAAVMELSERLLRCKMAGLFRLLDLFDITENGIDNMVTVKLDDETFLVNPYSMLCHEITALSLNIVNANGNIKKQGNYNFGVNSPSFKMHAAIHKFRPDIRCIVQVYHEAVVTVSSFTMGLKPISKSAVLLGKVTTYMPTEG